MADSAEMNMEVPQSRNTDALPTHPSPTPAPYSRTHMKAPAKISPQIYKQWQF